MQVSRVVVGRQAIQDRTGHIVGYELLFRGGPDAVTAANQALSGDQMTAEVVFGALSIGLGHVVSDKQIFCNADRGVLVGDLPITLPPDQTVIEVLESVVVDDEVLIGCRKLVEQGYRLALDDFVWSDGAEELLELASIVKIDVQATRGGALEEVVDRCRRFDVQLLAEKIETSAELDLYRAMDFDLFQGYLLERPVVVSGRTLEPGHASRLRMAAMLLSEDLDLDDLDDLLRADPAVAVQVIQLASVGRAGENRRKVATVRDALVLAGSRRIQNWMSLILARPERTGDHDHFAEVLTRARAVELLGGKIDRHAASMGFAAGMLSALDLLLGIPAPELRQALPIDDELAAAAFGSQTALARVVQDATAYQLGVPVGSRHSPLTDTDLAHAFAQAFLWSMETTAALTA